MKVASPTAILASSDNNYAVVNIQTSSKSSIDNFVFYVNCGSSTWDWFNTRGYGPKSPKSEADCSQRMRLQPDLNIFQIDDFEAFHIPRASWESVDLQTQYLGFFMDGAHSVLIPWIKSNWSDTP